MATPTPTKVRSLVVRPIKSADIAFPVAGIVDYQKTQLGERATGLDLKTDLYKHLEDNAAAARTNNVAQLKFNADTIEATLAPKALFGIRNQAQKARLNSLLARREVLFLQQYKHRSKNIDFLSNVYYDDGAAPIDVPAVTNKDPRGKLGCLRSLRYGLQRRHQILHNTRVAIDTKLYEQVKKIQTSTASTQGVMKAATDSVLPGTFTETVGTNSYDATGNLQGTQSVVGHYMTPAYFDQPSGKWKDYASDKLLRTSEVTTSYHGKTDGTGNYTQVTTTDLPSLSLPEWDDVLAFLREFINTENQLMEAEPLGHLVRSGDFEAAMMLELKATDDEIMQYQAEFAQTFLTCPFDGIVTALYKDLGESVAAGEPVLRVEDDTRVFLMGQIRHSGTIRLGQKVDVSATSVYDDGSSLKLDSTTVAVRGHDADNDEWEVILACDNPYRDPNDHAKGRLLPLNYHFDRDTTIVTFM